MTLLATLEVFRDGHWQKAAQLSSEDEAPGLAGACRFEYVLEYAAEYAGPENAARSGLSCRYPTDFQLHVLRHWPPFALDLLPSGYGRQQWLKQLDLSDSASSDWPLLLNGTAFPPGNIRVAEAVAAKDSTILVPTAGGELVAMRDHPGFSRDQVVGRGEHFAEYAFQHGIYAAGASDVQGVAPKLLLARDHEGHWHAEGRLDDSRVHSHWLVKRPRGDRAADRKVLRNEAAYMQVALQLGLRVHAELEWVDDSLFIVRFDRQVSDGEVLRYGMESLYSAAGVAEYGARTSQETLCAVILKHCSRPYDELLEYIKRDVLNVMMGNKDNHGRNSALLRSDDGRVELSPLFDFAPMYLDPEGIARVCRWSAEREIAGDPQWKHVVSHFPEHGSQLRADLRDFGTRLQPLANLMSACRVDDDIIEQRSRSIENHCQQLLNL
jgi:serine/threonine-protein kinase HipA